MVLRKYDNNNFMTTPIHGSDEFRAVNLINLVTEQ
jgi:hypothetical protein